MPVLSQRTQSERHRTRWALVSAGTLALLLACAAQQWYQWIHRFDPVVWRENPNPFGIDNRRSRMLGDLMRNHLRVGMRREQVRTLLGPPDAQSEVDRENNIDSYNLGHIGPMGIDPSILQLKYDPAGVLVGMRAFET